MPRHGFACPATEQSPVIWRCSRCGALVHCQMSRVRSCGAPAAHASLKCCSAAEAMARRLHRALGQASDGNHSPQLSTTHAPGASADPRRGGSLEELLPELRRIA
jgi:hypothetical protein